MTERWFEEVEKRFEKVQQVLDLLDQAKQEVAEMVVAESRLIDRLANPSGDFRSDENVFQLQ